MLIADSQVHVWVADRPDRPWPSQAGDLPRPHSAEPLTPERLLAQMDAAGVARAVLVSPSFEGTRNDVVCEAARRHPDRFTLMARFEIQAAGAREFLPRCRDLPGVRGVRQSFHRRGVREALLGEGIDWFWQQAQELDLPVMALVLQEDMPRVAQIVARYPKLRLTLDHLGLHEGKDEEAFKHFANVLALAKYPNVSVKASCLPLYTTDAYPFQRLHGYLRQVYDAYGAQRVFWGSDLSRLPCSYREGVTYFTEALGWLKGHELELVMGRALCQWLDWPL
jgi:predicted TIM-barrel fold metal-dependent hydrolase